MRTDLDEDIESFVRQLGDGGPKRGGVVFGFGGEPRRVLQAQVADDVRRRDLTDTVAKHFARDDAPRIPEGCQCDLENKLDRLIHLGRTNPRGRRAGHHLGHWRPAELTT